MIDNTKEYILCAAWKRAFPRNVPENPYKGGTNEILNIEIGYRHHDIYLRFGDELSLEDGAMGFYTSRGRFVSRIEAMKIACEAGQVPHERAVWTKEILDWSPIEGVKPDDLRPLASEDLYCCSSDGDSLNE